MTKKGQAGKTGKVTKDSSSSSSPPVKTFARPERIFVALDSRHWVRMSSDDLGDELAFASSKLDKLVAVSLIGMAEKEPAVVLQFENTPDIEVPYSSRTSAKVAHSQVLQVVQELKDLQQSSLVDKS